MKCSSCGKEFSKGAQKAKNAGVGAGILGGVAVVGSTVGAVLTGGALLPLIPIAATATVGGVAGAGVGPIECPHCGHSH